jgi:hypothetical protein
MGGRCRRASLASVPAYGVFLTGARCCYFGAWFVFRKSLLLCMVNLSL